MKEQRRIFEYLYKRLIQFQNQIIILNDQNNNIYDKTDQIKFLDNYLTENNDHAVDDDQHINDDTDNLSDFNDNFDFDNNTTDDLSLKNGKKQKNLKKKIEKLLNENDAACGTGGGNRFKQVRKQQNSQLIEHLNETRIFAKQQLAMKLNIKAVNKPSKICLFRRATIVILAAHRLIYFNNYNLNTSLNVFDSMETRHKFMYSQPTTISKFQIKKTALKCKLFGGF